MAKASSWGKRPTTKAAAPAASVDEFVNGIGKTVRLNVLIPADLHKRVKATCAMEGVSMTDVVTEFLEQRFPKK